MAARGVEEVDAADELGPRGLHRELDDRERRGVGREDRVAPRQSVELREERLFDGEVLDDRLDDEVAVGEVLELAGRRGPA